MYNLDDEVEPEEAEDEVDKTAKVSATGAKKGKNKSFFLDFDTGEVRFGIKFCKVRLI